MYSGKELESKTAKRRRYRLKEKVVYAGIEGADDFGERLYIQGEQKLSLSLAGNLLLISNAIRLAQVASEMGIDLARPQKGGFHYHEHNVIKIIQPGGSMSMVRGGS